MNKLLKVMAIISIFFISSQVMAKDIYVRAGSNGDGSKANPYATVDDALRRAFSGDVIHVAKGDYFGPGGNGLFVIEKPDLTLVGGYNADFSQRNPFLNVTRLMRGASNDPKECTASSARCRELVERQKIPITKSGYNSKGIVVGEKDHTNFVIDGFVIDGFTRHFYKNNEDLGLSKGPIGTACMIFYSPGVKVRNSVVFNCAGPGINIQGQGTKLPRGDKRESGDDWNEVSNTIVFNTLGKSIDMKVGGMSKSKPDKGAALLKNNTLVFNWDYTGESENLIVGRQTRITAKNNIFGFTGLGVRNSFGNGKLRLIGNVFFSLNNGYYKYMERSNAEIIMDEPNLLEGMNCKEKYACSKQSKGNLIADPQFKNMDGFFLDKFFNQIASQGGGKVTMDVMNQWRQMFGLNLQGSKGSGRKNYAPIWDPGENWENIKLFATNEAIKDKGAQLNGIGGQFQTYQSSSAKAVAKDYQAVNAKDLQRNGSLQGKVNAAGLKGIDVVAEMKVKEQQLTAFYLPDSLQVSSDKGWECYYDESRSVYLYVKNGTSAHALLKQIQKEGVSGLFKGTAYMLVGKALNGKIGFVIDQIESLDED